jgi:hypothetical protein
MSLATQPTDPPEHHPAYGRPETERPIRCIGCGTPLKPVQHSQTRTGDWTVRSHCEGCGLHHVHRRKDPPPS